MADLFFDVLIVGGGPAGSSCGLFLKKYAPQLRVAIIDKQGFPRDKPCGDGLSPGVIDILAEAGLHHLFSDKHAISTFELSHNQSRHIRYDLRQLSEAGSYGFVCDRFSFDQQLLQHAVAAGVVLFEKHEITHMAEKKDSTELICKHASGTTRLSGRIVVGADGAYSKLRQYLKIPTSPDNHKGVSLRYYCTTTEFQELSLRIDVLKNLGFSYGWVFPLSKTRANVGVGIDADVYKKNKINLNKELDAYVKWLQKTMPLEVERGSRAGYPLPYGTRLPQLAHGNKVLIGDAAAMINPLTGEGIYYALYAGRLLAKHLATAWNTNAVPERALHHFAADFEQQFQQHYRLNLKLKKLLISPFAPLFLNMLRHDKALLHKVMHVVMGNAGTLDVKHLPLKMAKRSLRYCVQHLKNLLPASPVRS